MAQTVVMPQLGNTVESCLLTAWHVKVGDTVDAGTVIADIETDKSTMDIPAGVAGTVLKLLVEEGDEVPVKSPILLVGEPGEEVADEPANEPLPESPNPAAEVADDGTEVGDEGVTSPGEAPNATGSEPVPDSLETEPDQPTDPETATRPATGVSPRARGLAADKGIPLDGIAEGTGPHGRVIERDVQAAIDAGPGLTRGARPEATAASIGASGTGIGGRVTTRDLAEPAEPAEEAQGTEQPAAIARPAAGQQVTETPLKGIRKLIADRMRESLAVSAQLTYDASAPADALLALRKRLKATDPSLGLSVVTIGDLVGLATAKVVRKHASLNAHLTDGVLRSFGSVNLGMAVDTPRGLMVPTIVDADRMGLSEFAATTKELAAQCQTGKISPDLLQGATFTLTNLGSFGIESFTPIVNQPQTGILGVNAITPRVVERDGEMAVEQRISFSLTADHQVVDGADAARFLRDLTNAIAAIDLFLMG